MPVVAEGKDMCCQGGREVEIGKKRQSLSFVF